MPETQTSTDLPAENQAATLPPAQHFYQPVARGFEREIAKRLAYWQRLKENLNDKE